VIIIESAAFVDMPDMPEVHTDARRTITEKVQGDLYVTRIEVTATHAIVLGNHLHTFVEYFEGNTGGVLLTSHTGNSGDMVAQLLPSNGWKLVVPNGTAHAFVLSAGAVLVSKRTQAFRDSADHHDRNTYSCKLVA
jgi:hypothetical protein